MCALETWLTVMAAATLLVLAAVSIRGFCTRSKWSKRELQRVKDLTNG